MTLLSYCTCRSVLNFDFTRVQNPEWRNPGENLSDYFNYGRDEYTWWRLSSNIASVLLNFETSGNGGDIVNVEGHQFGIPGNLRWLFQRPLNPYNN